MKRLILIGAILGLFLVSTTEAQISCFSYPGGLTSCDGPRGRNTIQQDLGNGQGTIMDERGNVTPYAMIPSPSQPSRPLNDTMPRLPNLPSLEAPGRPAMPYQGFEAPTAPIFLPGFGGEAGQ